MIHLLTNLKKIIHMKKIITLLFAAITCAASAQTNTFPSTGSAGIGTVAPNASSILEMQSTSKGVLIPRMTKTQRTAIASPATGLLIFQTNSLPGFYYYSGTAWTEIKGAGKGLSNLSATSINQSLLPDSDNVRTLGSVTKSWSNLYADGQIYLNGFRFIAQSVSENNTFIGSNAGLNNNTSSGEKNTFVGFESGYNTTESHNTGVGYRAVYSNSTGYNNTAVGTTALTSNTTGLGNTAVGSSAMYYNVSGNENTAIGFAALQISVAGSDNTACGFNSLKSNSSGIANTAAGSLSLYGNTSGSFNVAAGYQALYSNSGGVRNIAIGWVALFSNTNGNDNIAIGREALYYNTTGVENNAVGSRTLWKNTTGYGNTGSGDNALRENTTGYYNTGSGQGALLHNISGVENAAFGHDALLFNESGNFNAAIGRQSLWSNVSGDGNTAAGYGAGKVNDASVHCTFLGFDADQSTTSDYSNSTALGYGSRITASDQARIGNSGVSSIGGYAGWTTLPSDSRFKKNVQQNVPGLEFIKKLRPVTYNVDVKSIDSFLHSNGKDGRDDASVTAREKIVYTGFIAQEVEKAAQEVGYEFSGVDKPQNENSMYGLRYAEFTVPLVKAVQELSSENEKLKNEIQSLKDNLNLLSQKISSTSNSNYSKGFLGQNNPNPFNKKTIIPFVLPGKFNSASIKLINTQSGQTVMEYPLAADQISQEVNLNLPDGIYSYSLIVDGITVDTKQMINLK
jgi:trimeric autotransporter adhesin